MMPILRRVPVVAMCGVWACVGVARAQSQPAPEPAPISAPMEPPPAPSPSPDVPPPPAPSQDVSPAPSVEVQPAPTVTRAAPPEIPKYRFVINNLAVARYNALGLEDQIRAGVQIKLFEGASDLMRDNFVFFGITPKINPAYIKFGPSIEIQPVAAFNLRAAMEMIEYFSTFGYLQSFQSPAAAYSDSDLRDREWQDKNYSTTGMHFLVEPTIQLKFGPMVIRNRFSAEYWRMNTHASDPAHPERNDTVFYDATLDTLVPANGWVIADDLDIAYLRPIRTGRLLVGLRYSVVKPIYASTDLVGTDNAADIDNSHHRLGPLVAWTLYDRGYTSFNKPTVLVITGWYLHHRFRTGADNSQAIPYALLGFSFQSDLLH